MIPKKKKMGKKLSKVNESVRYTFIVRQIRPRPAKTRTRAGSRLARIFHRASSIRNRKTHVLSWRIETRSNYNHFVPYSMPAYKNTALFAVFNFRIYSTLRPSTPLLHSTSRIVCVIISVLPHNRRTNFVIHVFSSSFSLFIVPISWMVRRRGGKKKNKKGKKKTEYLRSVQE